MKTAVLIYVPMLALVALATVTDVRSRRIPNWLTLALVLGGLALAAAGRGPPTIGQAGWGLAAGFGIPFLFFAIRALGAGDVKLLAGIGVWVGAKPILVIMVAATVLGGVVALIQGLMQRRLGLLLGNTVLLAMNLANVRKFGTAQLEAMGEEPPTLKNTIPYAVPILLATTLFVAGRGMGWI